MTRDSYVLTYIMSCIHLKFKSINEWVKKGGHEIMHSDCD